MGASIAVEPQQGAPRLEVLKDGAPLPRDDQLPPDHGIPDPVSSDEGAPAEATIVRRWTGEQAVVFITGLHNIGAVGFAIAGKGEYARAWLASPDELNAGADSLARLLDRTPLSPDGAGPIGSVVDIVMGLQPLGELERRHLDAVMRARERARHRAETEAEEQRVPAADPLSTAVDQGTFTAPTPAPESNGRKRRESGPFAFSPDQLKVIDMIPGGDHHGSLRNPDAV